jgi:hypothetical protein
MGGSRALLTDRLKAVPYLSAVWRAEYPRLSHILDSDPMAPSGNLLEDNLLVRSGALMKNVEPGFAKGAQFINDTETDKSPPATGPRPGLILDAVRMTLPHTKPHGPNR